MTILSVNVPDMVMVLNGEALQFSFAYFPSKLRAVQWNGVNGTMEFETGAAVWFDNQAQVQDYLDQFAAEKARMEAAAAAAAAADQTGAAAV